VGATSCGEAVASGADVFAGAAVAGINVSAGAAGGLVTAEAQEESPMAVSRITTAY